MRKENDKKLFILVLVAMLIVMLFVGYEPVSEIHHEDNISQEEEFLINNNSLYIEMIDFDSCFIGGEGLLESTDMKTLLTKERLLSSDIKNVIIDEGITEIGYNCFNNYVYLESIKLGDATTRIRNGAIKRCPALKYIYLPDTLQKVGEDFLLNCPQNLIIITNGTSEKLRKLYDTGNLMIIESCESYEAFLDVAKQGVLIHSFGPSQLYTNSLIEKTDKLILSPGSTQYGPYTSVQTGKYFVEILGSNFDILNEQYVYVNHENTDAPINPVYVEEVEIMTDRITYKMTVDNLISHGEFCMFNPSESESVSIREINIYIDRVDDSPFLINWW